MNNTQIIFNHSMELLKEGKIKTTGRSFEMENENGEKITIYEPEPLHTFATWKKLGRVVKKGEHAVAAFEIWKQGKPKTKKDDDGNEVEVAGRMFLKNSFFFTIDQTEPIKEG